MALQQCCSHAVVVSLSCWSGHLLYWPSLPCQVRSILEILLDMLATPSEPVQRAVSDCMPALMPGLSADRPYLEALVARLLKQLGHHSYGHRCT